MKIIIWSKRNVRYATIFMYNLYLHIWWFYFRSSAYLAFHFVLMLNFYRVETYSPIFFNWISTRGTGIFAFNHETKYLDQSEDAWVRPLSGAGNAILNLVSLGCFKVRTEYKVLAKWKYCSRGEQDYKKESGHLRMSLLGGSNSIICLIQ